MDIIRFFLFSSDAVSKFAPTLAPHVCAVPVCLLSNPGSNMVGNYSTVASFFLSLETMMNKQEVFHLSGKIL
jgi:hypothetical protein